MATKNNQDGNAIQSESEMLGHILASVETLPGNERSKVGASIAGRICAETVHSQVSLPASDIATMDGYALRRSDTPGTLPVSGASWAGQPCTDEINPGHCVKIATGAWVPDGLDLVVPYEDVTLEGDHVAFGPCKKGESNIRAKGEELKAGEPVIEAGSLVTPRNLALLAGLGIDRIDLRMVPTIGVLSTGDEMRDVGEALPAGASFDANRPMLLALLGNSGFATVDLGIAKDDEASIEEAFRQAQASCDAIITIGGASVGDRDLVKDVVSRMGEIHSWKVAIKPGKPLVLGKVGAVPLFGLPGNPSSAYVTFSLLVLPGLWKIAGMDPLPVLHSFEAKLVGDLGKKPGRTEYFRATLAQDPKKGWTVMPSAMQGSGVLSVLARANCLLRLPEESKGAKDGDPVEVFPLESLP